MRISYAFLVLLRKDILELHERFECGGGWGLERTLQTWVSKQPWRWPMPTTFFEHLASICSQSSLCLFIFDTLEKMLFDVIHRSERKTPVSVDPRFEVKVPSMEWQDFGFGRFVYIVHFVLPCFYSFHGQYQNWASFKYLFSS